MEPINNRHTYESALALVNRPYKEAGAKLQEARRELGRLKREDPDNKVARFYWTNEERECRRKLKPLKKLRDSLVKRMTLIEHNEQLRKSTR